MSEAELSNKYYFMLVVYGWLAFCVWSIIFSADKQKHARCTRRVPWKWAAWAKKMFWHILTLSVCALQ